MGFFALNYWAVLAAAVANIVIGSLWYGPVFGAKWRSYLDLSMDDMHKMPLTAKQAMGFGMITALVMSFVTAQLVFALGVVTTLEAVMLAFWLWLGFAATLSAGSFLWEGRPVGLFFLNAAHWFVSFQVMTIILAWWL